eukprot:GHVS01103852.1.p2 GENE.GHVS01103852.1~~GHVS01103852.1.p2  ORF type:complete len:112 (+),score=26.55 GHVS01103852.1:93-428(+)
MSLTETHASGTGFVGVPSKGPVGGGGDITPQTPSTIASFPVQASTDTPTSGSRSPTQKLGAELDEAAQQSCQGSVRSRTEWPTPARRLLPNAAKPSSKDLLPFAELEGEYM